MKSFNKLFVIPPSILINPTDEMKITWEWYETGNKKAPDGVQDFSAGNHPYDDMDKEVVRSRSNYGRYWNKEIKWNAHQLKTKWAGYKTVIQISQNIALIDKVKKENCLQAIMMYRDDDGKVSATFMMSKMRRSQANTDFYTYYKFVKKVCSIAKMNIGKVTVFVASTQTE